MNENEYYFSTHSQRFVKTYDYYDLTNKMLILEKKYIALIIVNILIVEPRVVFKMVLNDNTNCKTFGANPA